MSLQIQENEEDTSIGALKVDASFSPVRRVAYY